MSRRWVRSAWSLYLARCLVAVGLFVLAVLLGLVVLDLLARLVVHEYGGISAASFVFFWLRKPRHAVQAQRIVLKLGAELYAPDGSYMVNWPGDRQEFYAVSRMAGGYGITWNGRAWVVYPNHFDFVVGAE